MRRQHVIKPFLDGNYPMISHGKGVFLYDKDGNEYIDGSSGAVTASIGHGVSEVIEAMEKQLRQVAFVYRSQFTNEPAERLAERLSRLAPGDLNWSFFVNSGSEAMETAMKITLQYWQEQKLPQKQMFLTRWMSYHGITIGALSLSGHVARRERFVPLLASYPTVAPPYCYRCPFSVTFPTCQLQCAHDLEQTIKKIGASHIAAFVAEPIVGAAGTAITPPVGYYETIKEICEKHHILFIADEVMTGIGRTGKMFGIDHWGVVPDLIALGKGLGAGYAPIAAVMVGDDILQPILDGSKLVMSGHTYSANPLACATALAVLDYVEKHDLVKNAETKGIYLKNRLLDLGKRFPIIGDVRGKGLLLGVEFVANGQSKESFPRSTTVTNHVIQKAMECGLLLYPASAGENGMEGDGVLIAPPLTITQSEMEDLLERFEKTLTALERIVQ